jgi:hypothetical protein
VESSRSGSERRRWRRRRRPGAKIHQGANFLRPPFSPHPVRSLSLSFSIYPTSLFLSGFCRGSAKMKGCFSTSGGRRAVGPSRRYCLENRLVLSVLSGVTQPLKRAFISSRGNWRHEQVIWASLMRWRQFWGANSVFYKQRYWEWFSVDQDERKRSLELMSCLNCGDFFQNIYFFCKT